MGRKTGATAGERFKMGLDAEKKVKIYDGRPTNRETLYKRALLAIMEVTDYNSHPYVIAETVLEAAGLTTIAPKKAEKRFQIAVEGGERSTDDVDTSGAAGGGGMATL